MNFILWTSLKDTLALVLGVSVASTWKPTGLMDLLADDTRLSKIGQAARRFAEANLNALDAIKSYAELYHNR